MQNARQIARTGMVVSAVLATMKISVGLAAHSAAGTADGFESAADILTSSLVFVGLTLAARPADENHPYGHGRVEILTGLLLGFLLAGAGCAIAWHGLTGATNQPQVPASWAIWPVIVSIGIKFWLVFLKSRHGRQIGS